MAENDAISCAVFVTEAVKEGVFNKLKEARADDFTVTVPIVGDGVRDEKREDAEAARDFEGV